MHAGSDAVPLAKGGALASLGRDLWVLGCHPVCMLNMLAYCPVQGAFGSYIFWGPKVPPDVSRPPELCKSCLVCFPCMSVLCLGVELCPCIIRNKGRTMA